MYILGFNCFGHDSAAALIKNGELIAFAEEERFIREKHTTEYPINAIRWCCDYANIQPRDLDHIVFYWNPYLELPQRLVHFVRYFPASIQLFKSRTNKFFPMLWIKNATRKILNLTKHTRIHFAEHHVLHASSAFFVSRFKEAAIMSVDAVGEWATAWMGYGKDNEIHELKKVNFPHSLGIIYGGLTEYLGFRFANGEGKVMGLAPYGEPERYIDLFREIIRCTRDGRFKVDLSYFEYHRKGRPNWVSEKFLKTFGPPRIPESLLTQNHKDIAAALQQRVNEICLHMAEWLFRRTGLSKICLAGGVCLNCVMNGKLQEESPFSDIWIQPAANDAGTSLGACFWLWNKKMKNPRSYVMEHAYHGPLYDEKDIEKALNTHSLSAHKVKNPSLEAAKMLEQGKIIAWFQGRMECGPRALGNRSILADPRNPDMKDLLNARVKFRESFRPFAPSVIQEQCKNYFDRNSPSPYMILTYNVKKNMQKKIPAVTHIDGTCRTQTVIREHNPAYYDLIRYFGELTGIYCILNTSLNIRGQPIINSPEEAIECFLKTGIDGLFLEHYMLKK